MASRAIAERTISVLSDPKMLAEMCDFITSGGTLYEFVKPRNISYRVALEWIRHDPDREVKFTQAEADRDRATADVVRTGLRVVGSVDPRRAFGPDGSVKSIHDMPEDVAMAISSFEVITSKDGDTTTKIKMNDRLQGLGLLGRTAGVFRDRVEVSGQQGGPIQTAVLLRSMSDADLLDMKTKLLRSVG